MNKLEQYRDEMILTYQAPVEYAREEVIIYSDGYEVGHKAGFNAAMDLQIPVKFADYMDICKIKGWGEGRIYLHPEDTEWRTSPELYQHWLENVYNPEEE